jgi:AI-2 transport protein TqsA
MSESHKNPSESHVRTACLLVLTFVAVGFALHFLRPVLVPFLLALLISYCMTAVIDVLARRLHLHRAAALATTAVLGLAILVLVGLLVAGSVTEMTGQLQTYGDKVAALTDWVARHVPLERLGIHVDGETGRVTALPRESVTAAVSVTLSEVANLLSSGALVLVFVILLLVGSGRPRPARGGLLAEVGPQVRRYILQMTLLSAVTGLLVGLALFALGVPLAFLFGFLTFLLNFIPTVGMILATLLPVPVILLSPDLSPAAQVLAVAAPAVIQGVIGALVQPRVLGRSFGLHPVSILLALIFFGMIWGVAGAFLATPIMAVLKIVLERVPDTRPVAALLAGTYGREKAPAGPTA